jgi:hypothetical protein
MPSEKALTAFAIAVQRANNLYNITVTDPWASCMKPGGNFEAPTVENQSHARAGIFAGIKSRADDPNGGLRNAATTQPKEVTVVVEKKIEGVKQFVEVQTQKFGQAVVATMPPEKWIELGNRTIAIKKGVCTDCAAAAAVSFLDGDKQSGLLVEIMASGTHAFVVVGRAGGEATVNDPARWGDDAFVIDIWIRNQAPKDMSSAVTWMSAEVGSGGASDFIRNSASRLRVEATLRS